MRNISYTEEKRAKREAEQQVQIESKARQKAEQQAHRELRAKQKAEQRAKQLAEQLRALGIEPN
ncbi:hypothetical protein [Candidatus Parabeggiatoa sp. HSG14]|uniref:hypothetical protein n=1 Tax=Candidatus Parabeggiatoa sp. HSG14 TaxID=3055593 RepID=UPI0025A7AD2F|nr:hypothetical protein [Thiotrichales bacterium HSG14]